MMGLKFSFRRWMLDLVQHDGAANFALHAADLIEEQF